MIIGYIVTKSKIRNVDGLVVQVDDLSKADSTKPILIVGWEDAKKHPLYKTILDKELSDGLFWTFNKSESRSDMERDIKSFCKFAYDSLASNIRYFYVNFFTLPRRKFMSLARMLATSFDERYIYINSSMIYVPFNGSVLGMSLSILEYCGVGKDKVMGFVRRNKANKVIDDSVWWVEKVSRNVRDRLYMVPYLVKK